MVLVLFAIRSHADIPYQCCDNEPVIYPQINVFQTTADNAEPNDENRQTPGDDRGDHDGGPPVVIEIDPERRRRKSSHGFCMQLVCSLVDLAVFGIERR